MIDKKLASLRMLQLSASFAVVLVATAGILAEEVCKNSGKPLEGTYQKCNCPSGFKGFDCSEKVRPCDKNPCKNNGKCSDDGVKCFKCDCPDGFKGFDCSQEVLPCEVSPCQNEGVCSNEKDGNFKCTCKSGYTGLVCTRKEPLFGSTVLRGNREWIEQLQEWLPTQLREKNMKLCYRASVNGWAASTFHSLCDKKGPTVVLVESGLYVFGGFASVEWGGGNTYKKGDGSFIFSFVNRDHLAPFKSIIYKNSNNAIYTNNAYGPTFGNGHDLYIANNANAVTASYTMFGATYKPPTGYSYNTPKTKALLAGSYNFSPTNVEVYFFVNSE